MMLTRVHFVGIIVISLSAAMMSAALVPAGS